MSPDAVPKQAFGFIAEDMEGETLLYRLGAHKAIHLNETAALIWKLCDGTRSVRTIIEELRGIFPDTSIDVSADTQEALSLLIGEGALIETGSSNTASR
ncbi:MAG: PqqD family protein [Hyphomicrobiaceae bacterium]|nr:PqqD family protein [Hyphomicrobiaceae bacterium]MCC0006775.1 PqqD family protein [Hyphomicrobiaceae bacterium]